MSGPVPFDQLEAALGAALADGPATVADLAEAVGRGTLGGGVVVEAALRALRARGLVQDVTRADGVRRWAWAGPARGAADAS
jgi:hypothetical protein